MSHCLTTQVEAQDEEHLAREIQNVLAVIKGIDAESDSKNESEYDPKNPFLQMYLVRPGKWRDLASSCKMDV